MSCFIFDNTRVMYQGIETITYDPSTKKIYVKTFSGSMYETNQTFEQHESERSIEFMLKCMNNYLYPTIK